MRKTSRRTASSVALAALLLSALVPMAAFAGDDDNVEEEAGEAEVSVGEPSVIEPAVTPAALPATPFGGLEYSGNPTCEDQGYESGFKIDVQNPNGAYSFGTPTKFSVDVVSAKAADDSMLFGFSGATVPVDAVLVKGGNGGFIYKFDPGVTAASGMHALLNGGGNKYVDISHVEFCFDLPPAPGPGTPADATIVFQKVVCESYDDVRFNETRGDRDDTGGQQPANADFTFAGNVTGTVDTADFDCKPGAGWNFRAQFGQPAQVAGQLGEYAYGQAAVSPNGTTDADGLLSVKLSALFNGDQEKVDRVIDGEKLWVSEIQQAGYTFGALQCHTDAINDDNLEFIEGVADGATVYCIAWNVKEPLPTVDVLKLWFDVDGELIVPTLPTSTTSLGLQIATDDDTITLDASDFTEVYDETTFWDYSAWSIPWDNVSSLEAQANAWKTTISVTGSVDEGDVEETPLAGYSRVACDSLLPDSGGLSDGAFPSSNGFTIRPPGDDNRIVICNQADEIPPPPPTVLRSLEVDATEVCVPTDLSEVIALTFGNAQNVSTVNVQLTSPDSAAFNPPATVLALADAPFAPINWPVDDFGTPYENVTVTISATGIADQVIDLARETIADDCTIVFDEGPLEQEPTEEPAEVDSESEEIPSNDPVEVDDVRVLGVSETAPAAEVAHTGVPALLLALIGLFGMGIGGTLLRKGKRS